MKETANAPRLIVFLAQPILKTGRAEQMQNPTEDHNECQIYLFRRRKAVVNDNTDRGKQANHEEKTQLQIEELRADISDLSEKVEALMTVKDDIATLVLVWNNATGALWIVKRLGLAVIGIGAFLAGSHQIFTTFIKGSGNGG